MKTSKKLTTDEVVFNLDDEGGIPYEIVLGQYNHYDIPGYESSLRRESLVQEDFKNFQSNWMCTRKVWKNTSYWRV